MQKGVALYITIVIMAILLAIVLGVSAILMNQIKIIKGIENSVIAFHAADTGIERVLKIIMADDEVGLTGSYSETLDNNASYDVEVSRCPSINPINPNCNFSGSACADTPPIGVLEDVNCAASRYCVKSKGTYPVTGGVQRAIEISYGGELPTVQTFESYTNSNTASNFGDTTLRAQTFTPNQAHTIAMVKLRLGRTGMGIVLGNLNAGIKSVDVSSHPTGIDLCSGTILATTIVIGAADYDITLSGLNCDLSAGTKYAIVVSAPNSSFSALLWSVDQGAGAYGGGNAEVKLGILAPWQSILNDDHVFEEKGCPL